MFLLKISLVYKELIQTIQISIHKDSRFPFWNHLVDLSVTTWTLKQNHPFLVQGLIKINKQRHREITSIWIHNLSGGGDTQRNHQYPKQREKEGVVHLCYRDPHRRGVAAHWLSPSQPQLCRAKPHRITLRWCNRSPPPCMAAISPSSTTVDGLGPQRSPISLSFSPLNEVVSNTAKSGKLSRDFSFRRGRTRLHLPPPPANVTPAAAATSVSPSPFFNWWWN